MTTWPYPERPGVPLNPEVDGWHWVQDGKDAPFCAKWSVDDEDTEYWIVTGDEEGWAAGTVGRHWTYLGPVRTDADVQAAAKAARQQALEDAAALCDPNPDYITPAASYAEGYADGREECAFVIRALKEGGE